MNAHRAIWRLVPLVLTTSLGAAGCGWLSHEAPAPGGPVSEAVRDTQARARAALAPPPPAAPASPPEGPDILDRVIAVVNSDAVTLSDLQETLAAYLYESKEPARPDQEQELKERLLRRMIDNRLQLQEATREQITVEEAEVNEQLADVMKRANVASQEELDKLVKAQGLTLEGVNKRLREQLLIQKVVQRKVQLRVSVTEEEIELYLFENREKLETGLSYHARHILMAPDRREQEEAWEAGRARAEEVWAKVRAGEDFTELARRYSDDPTAKEGGDLGVLKQGELASDLEGQILRLRPGEASAPYRSTLGFHIFKLEWKEGFSGEALAQAKRQIRDILFRQKYAVRLAAWLEEIRKRAIIEIRL